MIYSAEQDKLRMDIAQVRAHKHESAVAYGEILRAKERKIKALRRTNAALHRRLAFTTGGAPVGSGGASAATGG